MILLDQRQRTLLFTTIELSGILVSLFCISLGSASYWKMQREPNDSCTYSRLHYRKETLGLQYNFIINGQLTCLTLFLKAEVLLQKYA